MLRNPLIEGTTEISNQEDIEMNDTEDKTSLLEKGYVISQEERNNIQSEDPHVHKHRKKTIHIKTWIRVGIELIIAFFFTYGFDTLFENKLCDLIFRCGCTWNWAGGSDKCNIHHTDGPKCPFCGSQGIYVFFTKFWVIMFVSYGIMLFYSVLKRKDNLCAGAIRVICSMAIYFVSGALIGLAFKLSTGYPHYFVG